MAQENAQRVQKMYDAFARGDVAAVLGGFSSDIVWNEAENFPYADGNPYVGPAAVAAGVFARCATEWDDFTIAIEEILDAGDTVVALGRYKGTYKASGRAMDAQLVHVWRFSGGVAVNFQQFADTLQVHRATT